jgi:hypothetical protein
LEFENVVLTSETTLPKGLSEAENLHVPIYKQTGVEIVWQLKVFSKTNNHVNQ